MGITHVLRGEEWLPSTPKHLQLYKALKFPVPKFAHLPLMVNPDGSKLSKRTGDVKVEDYIEKGYEPDALLNFVALLGWSPQSSSSLPEKEKEKGDNNDNSQAIDLLSVSQLIEKFSLEGINKNRPTLQQGKLDWLNRNHIKMKLFDQENSEGGSEERRKDLALRVRRVIEEDLGVKDNEEVLKEEYLLAVVDALKVSSNVTFFYPGTTEKKTEDTVTTIGSIAHDQRYPIVRTLLLSSSRLLFSLCSETLQFFY